MKTLLWNYLKLPIKILFTIGLCPFSLNATKKNYHCTWQATLYSIIFPIVIFILSSLIISNSTSVLYVNFSEIFNIFGRIYFISLHIFYASTHFLAVWHRKSHVNLLNCILSLKINANLKLNANRNYYIVFTIFIFQISMSLTHFVYKGETIKFFLINLMLAFKVLTQLLFIVYTKTILRIISFEISRISNSLKNVLNSDHSTSDVVFLLILFKQFENLLEIKQMFGQIFSGQFASVISYDSMIITMCAYQLINLAYFFKYIWFILVFVLPQILKLVLMIASLENFISQVN